MLLPFSASAQKGKRKAVSKKKAPVTIVQEEPEEEEEDPRLLQMLNATERIIVIDSMVVGRNNVLAAIFQTLRKDAWSAIRTFSVKVMTRPATST